jgi:hypothetical protein
MERVTNRTRYAVDVTGGVPQFRYELQDVGE